MKIVISILFVLTSSLLFSQKLERKLIHLDTTFEKKSDMKIRESLYILLQGKECFPEMFQGIFMINVDSLGKLVSHDLLWTNIEDKEHVKYNVQENFLDINVEYLREHYGIFKEYSFIILFKTRMSFKMKKRKDLRYEVKE